MIIRRFDLDHNLIGLIKDTLELTDHLVRVFELCHLQTGPLQLINVAEAGLAQGSIND